MSRWYVVALPVVVGCGAELTAPFSEPTRLDVSVAVTDTAGTGAAGVAAQLTLDPAIWDTPDAIVDSSLVVNGSQLMPMSHAQGTALRYSGEWPLNVLTTDGTVVVELPSLAAPDGTYDPMTLAVPLRSGNREIVLGPDEDLVLRVMWPSDSSKHPGADQWHLDIRGSQGGLSVLSYSGTPAAITIPSEWLQEFSAPFSARVSGSYSVRLGERTAAYQVTAFVQYTFRWYVTRPTP